VKNRPYKRVAYLDGNSVVVVYYLRAYEIRPAKNGGLCGSGLIRGATTVIPFYGKFSR